MILLDDKTDKCKDKSCIDNSWKCVLLYHMIDTYAMSSIRPTLPPAPIVLIVFNRPDHTAKVLESLSANELAAESDLYVYADCVQG